MVSLVICHFCSARLRLCLASRRSDPLWYTKEKGDNCRQGDEFVGHNYPGNYGEWEQLGNGGFRQNVNA